jgi:hypothetical protein
MELIPILSTIILVATISTFILSIGAYILYKVREKQNVTNTRSLPKSVQAELIVPTDLMPNRIQTKETKTPQYQSPFSVQKPAPNLSEDKRGYSTGDPGRFSAERNNSEFLKSKAFGKKSKDTRFFKYTSEGFVPTEEDRIQGVIKWR